MKMKRMLAIVVTVLLCLGIPPGTAKADTANVYTVILDPGEGIGESITYSSNTDEFAENWRSAINYDCKFYTDNGKTCFWLKNSYNPFTAQQNYVFDGWEGSEQYNELKSEETTFTAKWREDLLPTLGPVAGIPVANGGYVYMGGIQWRVIGISDDAWLLISAQVLGDRGDWETAKGHCDTVYNSFSQPEQDAVIPTIKQDGMFVNDNDDGSTTTFDSADLYNAKLFLLTAAEARWYFSDNDDRCPGEWWLRSPISNSDFAGVVNYRGDLGPMDTDDEGVFGARPAFQLKLASVLFTSPAEGGKISGNSNGEMTDVATNETNEWKLTLHDSLRDDAFTANVVNEENLTKEAGYSDWNIPVTWSGARTGDNDYVSAILCNSENIPLYYGQIANNRVTSPETGQDVTIPEGLSAGAYKLHIFSEQVNGDYMTDYASAFHTIDLTVKDGSDGSYPPVTSCTVTFDANAHGRPLNDLAVTVKAGETVSRPVDPAADGYTFAGWYTEPDCVNAYDFETSVTADLILYAKWEPRSSGGGGGAVRYLIKGTTDDKGSVSLSADRAKRGDPVTVTVTPDEGYQTASVLVTDKNGKEVDVKDNGDGTFTFTMPASAVTVTPTFTKIEEPDDPDSTACPKDDTCPITPFTDTDKNEWYHDGVHWALEKAIMNGTSDNTFEPMTSTTRAMIVTMLWRMEGSPMVDGTVTFKDVSDGQWYTDAIRWAASNGIVTGYDSDTFGTNDSVTREQLATILYRNAQSKGKGFTGTWYFPLNFDDADQVSEWADEAMHWMIMNGVIQGMSDKELSPQGDAVRAQVATMLMRFSEKLQA